MRHRLVSPRALRQGAVATLLAIPLAAASQHLYGILWDNGDLYRIDPSSAAVTRIGATRIPFMADIQMGPDGFLYGFSTGTAAKTYKINPETAGATELRPLGLAAGTFVFEGAMAPTAPNSYEYWCSGLLDAGDPGMFKLDVRTGAVTDKKTLSGDYDINGWTLGTTDAEVLFGLDRESGRVQHVDAGSGTVVQADLWPGAVGEVGGMAQTDDGTVYIATGGPGSVIAGSNSLYSATIQGTLRMPTQIGVFNGIGGSGFSGLAVPEPALLASLGVLLALAVRRRK